MSDRAVPTVPGVPGSVVGDRMAGALVGLAAGDALGAGYEFTRPAPDADIAMIGGGIGGFDPGEWTDDTAQAVGIAEVTATGTVDLDAIGTRFLDWFAGGPKDCGVSTAAVLRSVDGDPRLLRQAAASFFAANPRGAAGNGTLMRTAPVALAHLGDDDAIAAAAMDVAALTHGDPLAGEACVVWCVAIDRAIREGRLDGVWDGVDVLPAGRRDAWTGWLREVDDADPRTFRDNGFVVRALQAAWAAIRATDVEREHAGGHLADGLRAAVRIGDDTDTVAAIAGQLLGARYGVSAVPAAWRVALHGWPGMDVDDLVRLALLTAGQRDAATGWPGADHVDGVGVARCVPAPHDQGLLLGNLAGIDEAIARGATTVVSLCRVGTQDVPEDVEHCTVWLTDSADPAENPNLALLLDDTTSFVAARRHAGEVVFLHCAAGASRTPTVAALVAADAAGRPPGECWAELARVLPVDPHNGRFQSLLRAERS